MHDRGLNGNGGFGKGRGNPKTMGENQRDDGFMRVLNG